MFKSIYLSTYLSSEKKTNFKQHTDIICYNIDCLFTVKTADLQGNTVCFQVSRQVKHVFFLCRVRWIVFLSWVHFFFHVLRGVKKVILRVNFFIFCPTCHGQNSGYYQLSHQWVPTVNSESRPQPRKRWRKCKKWQKTSCMCLRLRLENTIH